MEGLLVLLAILLALTPVAVIFLAVGFSRMKRRVEALEKMLAGQQITDSAPADDVVSEPEPARPADVPAPAPVAAASGPWEAENRHDLRDTPVTTIADEPARAFVFQSENVLKLRNWVRENWFLAIAALSLALAGVFLVQYGVEKGLITAFWRVMGAAILGVFLIWLGEFVRRNWGDADGNSTEYLPSTFSGAGLVALFAAVLAARQLYDLIGPDAAFIWMVLVAAVAVVLGWFYGPFLTVVGILGSVLTPFVIGGQSDNPELFYYYFALIAVAALLIDALRRWAWVTAIALITASAASVYILDLGAGDQHFLAYALIVTAAAVIIPPLSFVPQHSGAMAIRSLFDFRKTGQVWPEFPTRVATYTYFAAAVAALWVAARDIGSAEVWLAVFTLVILYVAATVWFRSAPALDDTAPIAAIILLILTAGQAFDGGALYQAFQAGLVREPESVPPGQVTTLMVLVLVGAGLAFLRAWGGERHGHAWAVGAAILCPLALAIFEVWWMPEPILGAGRWAAHAIIPAAVMVLFAERIAREDMPDLRRAAYFTISALSLIAFALIVMLSSAALTLALAVMVVVSAFIDRRLDMRLVAVFASAGVIVATWRLVLDPGVLWAIDAPLLEVLVTYLGTIALLVAAHWAFGQRQRTNARLVAESAAWLLAAVLANVLLYRWMGAQADTHWGVSLAAMVWLCSAAVQLYRLQLHDRVRRIRWALAALFGAVASVYLAQLIFDQNPVWGFGELVLGPPIADSLLVAFVPPAILFAFVAWRFTHLPHYMRLVAIWLSALFGAAYVACEIRRLWQGPDLTVLGTVQGEVYSYTVAMLIAAVLCLFVAFSRRSVQLRQIALIGIGITIAKVFLIDMSGLTGLYRVASFLGLGLSLAGLAWVVRRMAAQWEDREAR